MNNQIHYHLDDKEVSEEEFFAELNKPKNKDKEIAYMYMKAGIEKRGSLLDNFKVKDIPHNSNIQFIVK